MDVAFFFLSWMCSMACVIYTNCSACFLDPCQLVFVLDPASAFSVRPHHY